jgi:hypothetical protein
VGRLVITHSTYVDGLIVWLKRLAADPAIQTITPGVIARVKGRSQSLRLRVSTRMLGGFKLVARKGAMVQEVFVVTSLEADELERRLQASQPSNHNKKNGNLSSPTTQP